MGGFYQPAAAQTDRAAIVAAFGAEMGRDPSPSEAQYAHSVCWAEGNCGRGFRRTAAGSRGNNWGAVQLATPSRCGVTVSPLPAPPQSIDAALAALPSQSPQEAHCNGEKGFLWVDSSPKPVRVYWVYMRSYPTPADGARGTIATLYRKRPSVLAAATAGSLAAGARAQRLTKYYEGFGATEEARIANYIDFLRKAQREIMVALDEPDHLSKGDTPDAVERTSVFGSAAIVLVVATVGVAFAYGVLLSASK